MAAPRYSEGLKDEGLNSSEPACSGTAGLGRRKERPEPEGRVWTVYLDPRTPPRVIDLGCRGVAHKTFRQMYLEMAMSLPHCYATPEP